MHADLSVESGAKRQPPRWRWLFRLSLRTLFILVTLAAIWLGVTFKRVRDERAAVARIHELGGTVRYNHEGDTRIISNPVPPGHPWLRRLLGPEFFQEVVHVRLGKSAATDDDLRLVGKLRGLTRLDLSMTKVTDAGLYELRHCRRLRSLNLYETKVSGAGIQHLDAMQDLTDLVLWNTAMDDDGVRHLSQMRNLGSLILGQTRVTSRGVGYLRTCAKLSSLTLSETRVDDSAVGTLTGFPQLIELHVTASDISGRGLLRIREALPNCELTADDVSISGTSQKRSKAPSYSGWNRVVERILALDKERRVKLLNLSWSTVTDEQLMAFHALTSVEAIDLRGSDVTAEGAESLRAALPRCEIRH